MKLLPQKMHYQNCSLKKYFFEKYICKTTLSKKYVCCHRYIFSKSFPQKYIFKIASSKIHFQKWFLKKYLFWNCSLKNYIFKVILSKKTFSNILCQTKTFSKQIFKIAFSKLPLQKAHSPNCSLKKYFLKKIYAENYSFKKIHFQTYSLKELHFQTCSLKKHKPDSQSSSDSSEQEKSIKLSLSNYFFQCIYTLSEILGNNDFYLSWEQALIWLLLNKCESPPQEFFTIKVFNFITMRFCFGFERKLLQTGSLSNSFFISELTFSQIVLYFSNKSSSSIIKYILLVCPS